jgi:conjugal transfer pilus assembly protein TraB
MSEEENESGGGFSEKLKNISPKTRQYLVLGMGASILIGILMFSVSMWDSAGDTIPKTAAKPDKKKNITTPGTQVDTKVVWMTQSQAQMRELAEAQADLNKQLTEMKKRQEEIEAGKANQPVLPPIIPNPPSARGGAAPNPNALPPPPPEPDVPRAPGIATQKVSSNEATGEKGKDGKDGKTAPKKTYLPAGTFMHAVLLGGLDAPTGGQAQNNPWPVLMRVQDNAFLPNRYRAKVKECFLLGSGFGDLSSERAYLRLESMSCVLRNGDTIDAAAKGYVVGEDGKAGMRGRLITKQGQALANALLYGVVSGIGNGLQQSSISYSNSALGSVGTVDAGKEFQAGIGEGLGRALDRMSQYYIKLAEKLFPVIEIDGMRQVDVVLTKGISLGLNETGEGGDYSEIWKRGRAASNRSYEVDPIQTRVNQ